MISEELVKQMIAQQVAEKLDGNKAIASEPVEVAPEKSGPIVKPLDDIDAIRLENLLLRQQVEGLKKEYQFNAITNGTWLKSYTELLHQDIFKAVQITLDGNEYEHNIKRKQKNGKGTFKQISDNISYVLSKNIQVNLRINIDTANEESLMDLFEIFIKNGWMK